MKGGNNAGTIQMTHCINNMRSSSEYSHVEGVSKNSMQEHEHLVNSKSCDVAAIQRECEIIDDNL
jgi:hypothetical protein